MYLPTLSENYTSQQVTDIFAGYNHNMKTRDGEFYDMQNLTSSFYPLLANRAKRGAVCTLTAPQGLIAKDALAYVANQKLYYNGNEISGVTLAAGDKELYSMGAYLLIWPDKYYYNTADATDSGYIENFSLASAPETDTAVTYSICKRDGSAYDAPAVSASAPESPENGELWLDTSGAVHALRQWSSSISNWTSVATVYVKISCPGIGLGFKKLDGVNISGCEYTGDSASMTAQIGALNGSHIIYDCDSNYIVTVGLIDQSFTQFTTSDKWVSVSRAVPDMDYITEAQNRLWGCKYGLVDGKTVNEIYSCALGDFKNWEQYLGLSTDSYRASVGTDGQWTGAVTHLGYPIFFKENCLHKVHVSSSGAHQIADTACRGVQKGSSKSLVVVNETLYYKGRAGVCAYDGSLPVSVSDAFGEAKYYDAAAGSFGDKYYISMRDGADAWHLFVLDTAKGMWHREDSLHAKVFAKCDDELYYIDAFDNRLMAINGTVGAAEPEVTWSWTTGLMGYDYVEHKYISRFNLRMKLPPGSHADILIEYDSDCNWHNVGHMDGTGTKTFMLPVRPRRCDHFRLRMTGSGDIRIYSFSKILERGSDC